MTPRENTTRTGSQLHLTDEQLETVAALTARLAALNISARFTGVIDGPVVSVYKFAPFGSTRVSTLESLAPDFAVATGSESVMVKRMPGESSVGIFVPRAERNFVDFRAAVTALHTEDARKLDIPLCLGIDHYGRFVIEDLVSMPHILIAGSTGSGKSTLLNALLTAMIYALDSKQIGFVISDTKGVEFARFAKLPHMLFPPAISVYETCERMEWLAEETDRRMKQFANIGARNIHELRKLGLTMPYIVLVIDELADLLADRTRHETRRVSVSKLGASLLSRIVARSRAAGVYVIGATQRPSVDVVNGVIKANFPARVAFRLPSQADSRTVLSTGGAEHLLSQGDMLFLSPCKPGLQRVHAPLATEEDLNGCIEYAIYKEA